MPTKRKRPAPTPEPRDAVAIGGDGKLLPYTPQQVERILEKGLRQGEILAVVLRMPSGDLACEIVGEPSKEIADALQHIAWAYAKAFVGQ